MRKSIDARAKYCSDSCKVMACRERKAWCGRLKTATQAVTRLAPKEALYYRLGIRREGLGQLVFFGPFELEPLEPPRVAVAGVYTIEFLDAVGRRLETPSALASGIFIKNPDAKAKIWFHS